jgi:PAS domain S-box-containing protein
MNQSNNKTILLVEDEALIAMAERQTLEQHGYRVVQAANGKQAVHIAAEQPEIDLVLMDINLGAGMDGTEAAQLILETRELPIVFLSSHTDPAVVEKTERITSYGYIVKNSGDTVLLTSLKMAFRLFESRKLAADTFDHSINGLCVHRLLYDASGNPYDCEYLKVNTAFERQTGLTAHNIIGKTIRNLYPDDQVRGVIELYSEVVFSRTPVRKEIWFGPMESWYELSVFPTQGDEFTVVVQNVTERKLTIEKLAREKERLRVTLQSVGDAVITTDAHGHVTLLNPVAAQLTGFSAEAAAGQPLSEVFHIFNSRSREPVENPVGRVLAEGRTVGLANHTVLASANGEEYQIADSAAPIRDSAGEIIGVVLVFRDVSQEYAAQQELRERERNMRQAQELAHLGSWRINLETGTVEASPTAYKIYGMTEGRLTLGQIQSVPLAAYREKLDAALHNLIHHGQPYDVEFEIRRQSDGEIRHIHSVADYDAEQNVVVGTLHDITELKRAMESLREERARYSTITEMSPIGITTVDSDGMITYANSAAERILGLHRDQITSRTYDAPEWEHTAPDGGPFPDEQQPFSIVKRTLKPVYDIRHGITWPDGSHIELSINASPVLTDDGGFDGMIATVEDITERKQAEDHIRALLREKELLLRESHHRVMNNMNTINSLLSLQSQTTESSDAREALNDAAHRLQSMARVYNKLFRSTRTGPISIREFLIPLLDEAVEVFTSVTPVRVSTEVEDVPLDSGTLSSLGIVVNELVTNSVKYAFSGEEEVHVSVTAGKEDSQIIITYRDNGPGLDPDATAGENTGFGMQLVQSTIESLGGRIEIHPGPGFHIEMELPV